MYKRLINVSKKRQVDCWRKIQPVKINRFDNPARKEYFIIYLEDKD